MSADTALYVHKLTHDGVRLESSKTIRADGNFKQIATRHGPVGKQFAAIVLEVHNVLASERDTQAVNRIGRGGLAQESAVSSLHAVDDLVAKALKHEYAKKFLVGEFPQVLADALVGAAW
jgi:hypothetical protein